MGAGAGWGRGMGGWFSPGRRGIGPGRWRRLIIARGPSLRRIVLLIWGLRFCLAEDP